MTPLSKLSASQWSSGGDGTAYEPVGRRIAGIMALCRFDGDFDGAVPGGTSMPHAPGQTFGTALELAPGLAVFGSPGNSQATLTLRVIGAARLVWRAMTNPDGAFMSYRAGGGNLEDHLLSMPAALVYALSGGQGKSPDASNPVLELLCAGCLACLARCAHFERGAWRGYHHAMDRQGAMRPLLVLALPTDWKDATTATDKRSARVWSFKARSDGRVGVTCSQALTIGAALDFAYDRLQQ